MKHFSSKWESYLPHISEGLGRGVFKYNFFFSRARRELDSTHLLVVSYRNTLAHYSGKYLSSFLPSPKDVPMVVNSDLTLCDFSGQSIRQAVDFNVTGQTQFDLFCGSACWCEESWIWLVLVASLTRFSWLHSSQASEPLSFPQFFSGMLHWQPYQYYPFLFSRATTVSFDH